MNATVKLFKAVVVDNKKKKQPSKNLLAHTIPNGILFAPEVVANYEEQVLIEMSESLGLSAEKINNSFHKSWDKIKTAPYGQLVLEQIIHYITTYGFESMGVYDENTIYIPAEKLQIPAIAKESFKFVVIKGLTKKELKEKLLAFLNTGIALKEDTIKEVIEVTMCDAKLTSEDILGIKNREVKICLMSNLNIIPEDPVEFLRLAVYRTTKETLLIKNKYLFKKIKESSVEVRNLFWQYRSMYGFEKLSSIFNRFKPLFIAFKGKEDMKPIINKIARLSKTNHKPMPENFINSVTSKIKNRKLGLTELEFQLKTATIFQKIKLAYALKYRTKDVNSIVYKVRNGKGFTSEFSFVERNIAKKAYDIVYDSIAEDMSKNVKGKKIFIPEGMNYSLPATEKQFSGFFPTGTSVSIPSNVVFGVNWKNVNHNRIDLDLSAVSLDGKYGWDRMYRSDDGKILFSGDMTDASGPNGSSELFYVARQMEDNILVMLNYFNWGDEALEVPFKVFVASEEVKNMKQNYMVNPNNVVVQSDTKIKEGEMVIGLVRITTKGARFYFCEFNTGKSRSTSGKYGEKNRNYLFNYYTDTIDLKGVLEKAGAVLVEKVVKADIDLSPQSLDKTTIINLIVGDSPKDKAL